jgi:hypothetical protein
MNFSGKDVRPNCERKSDKRHHSGVVRCIGQLGRVQIGSFQYSVAVVMAGLTSHQ